MRAIQYAAIAAFAATITTAAHAGLSVDIGAVRDNTIFDEGDLSNGAGQYMFAGQTAGEFNRRALIAFDVAGSVPAGATITDVTLTLHMSRTIGSTYDVSMHRLLADWGEGASDAPNEEGAGVPAEDGDATWDHTFYDGEFWATDGGDFVEDASATTAVGQIGFYQWSSAQLVADAQSFLDSPGGDFGWILVGDESTNFTAKRFDTHENPNEAMRPVLSVSYLPAPGVLAVFGLLGVAPCRRRRA